MFLCACSSENIDWSIDGVKTLSVERVEEGDLVHYEVTCQSSHLTSFAILVDVHGVTSVCIYAAMQHDITHNVNYLLDYFGRRGLCTHNCDLYRMWDINPVPWNIYNPGPDAEVSIMAA